MLNHYGPRTTYVYIYGKNLRVSGRGWVPPLGCTPEYHTPWGVLVGCSSPLLKHWACKWINHWSLWRMASVPLPGLWLPCQSHDIAALWLVSNYTAWWRRHMCVNNLPKVVTWQWNSQESNSQPFEQQADTLIIRLHHKATSEGLASNKISGKNLLDNPVDSQKKRNITSIMTSFPSVSPATEVVQGLLFYHGNVLTKPRYVETSLKHLLLFQENLHIIPVMQLACKHSLNNYYNMWPKTSGKILHCHPSKQQTQWSTVSHYA